MGIGEISGYLSPSYGASLNFTGIPLQLSRSGGCLLKRSIPGTWFHDAMGSYPLLCCKDWSVLADDFLDLDGDLVSITAVADPFGDHGGASGLSKAFPGLVRPFKEHYIVDLRQRPHDFVSRHHRQYARRALAVLRVERADEPIAFLDEWVRLYSFLTERQRIGGIARFTRDAFQQQLTIPGLVMLRALHGNETVGITLWYHQQDRAYVHLGAYDNKGYAYGASYALFSTALDFFAQHSVRLLALGAGSGLNNETDGLSQFKRGWATGTRTAYLCGRICKPDIYFALVARKGGLLDGSNSEGFFPSYRA